MTTPVLELFDLSAAYGDVAIVRDFCARLDAGTITTLIGVNGAGKSTLLRAIHGTCRCWSVRIVFAGEAVEGMQPWQRLLAASAWSGRAGCNFPFMTVAENLKMGCHTLASARHQPTVERVTALFPLLRAKWRVRNLSGREQQVLEMAMVLLVAPSLLLLDEPSLGLSPKMQGDVSATIEKVAHAGVTAFVERKRARGLVDLRPRAGDRTGAQSPGWPGRRSARRSTYSPRLPRRQHRADAA